MSTVLVIAARDDWPTDRVVKALTDGGAEVFRMDTAEFPQEVTLAGRIDARRGWSGGLTTAHRAVDLADICAVYYRAPKPFHLSPAMSDAERRFAAAQARSGLGGIITALNCRWVSHPAAMTRAEYKPLQLATARDCGLTVPPTLITNRPDTVRAFAGDIGGQVVCKPVATPVFIEDDNLKTVYTRRLTEDDLDDLRGIDTTAHLFQAWVDNAYEVRLTVVGDRLFAAEVHAGSDAAHTDWRSDKGVTVWCEHRAATNADALAAVYRDQTLVTALDPATAEQVDETTWTGIPTSSSTLPSLMAGMLEDLSVDDGHRILEIGTGTGYNAALLCARLGEHLVHSVDIDPALVEAAEQRLADAGYAPQVIPCDGTRGLPTGRTFDRIIATCSVPAIPQPWIDQSKPGTILVADVALGIEGGLIRLAVDGQQRALGHFTTTAGRFMAARTDARTYVSPQRPARAPEAETRPTTVTAADIRGNYAFRLLLAFHLPEAEFVYHVDETTGVMSTQIQQPDGSWARTPLTGANTGTVTCGGDTELLRVPP